MPENNEAAQASRVRRLAGIGLRPEDVTAPPVVVKSGQRFVFSSENPAANLWMKRLGAAQSLDQLKEIAGVPNSVFERNDSKQGAVHPEVSNVEVGPGVPLELTDPNSLARRVAANLVYGYADPAYVAQPGVQALTQVMCAALEGQYAVVGKDLTVHAGGVADLGRNPIVQFDTITIYGDGQIIVHENQKVQAETVQWLESES
jgi:hypothetical protein